MRLLVSHAQRRDQRLQLRLAQPRLRAGHHRGRQQLERLEQLALEGRPVLDVGRRALLAFVRLGEDDAEGRAKVGQPAVRTAGLAGSRAGGDERRGVCSAAPRRGARRSGPARLCQPARTARQPAQGRAAPLRILQVHLLRRDARVDEQEDHGQRLPVLEVVGGELVKLRALRLGGAGVAAGAGRAAGAGAVSGVRGAAAPAAAGPGRGRPAEGRPAEAGWRCVLLHCAAGPSGQVLPRPWQVAQSPTRSPAGPPGTSCC
jgi:hypothetical protein